MTLQHTFIHVFEDGAIGQLLAIYDTDTRKVTQQRLGPCELSDGNSAEFQAWVREIDARFCERHREISYKRTFETYPDLLVEGSPLYNAFQALHAQMKEQNDAMLVDLDGPFLVATMAAKSLGIEPAE